MTFFLFLTDFSRSQEIDMLMLLFLLLLCVCFPIRRCWLRAPVWAVTSFVAKLFSRKFLDKSDQFLARKESVLVNTKEHGIKGRNHITDMLFEL